MCESYVMWWEKKRRKKCVNAIVAPSSSNVENVDARKQTKSYFAVIKYSTYIGVDNFHSFFLLPSHFFMLLFVRCSNALRKSCDTFYLSFDVDCHSSSAYEILRFYWVPLNTHIKLLHHAHWNLLHERKSLSIVCPSSKFKKRVAHNLVAQSKKDESFGIFFISTNNLSITFMFHIDRYFDGVGLGQNFNRCIIDINFLSTGGLIIFVACSKAQPPQMPKIHYIKQHWRLSMIKDEDFFPVNSEKTPRNIVNPKNT